MSASDSEDDLFGVFEASDAAPTQPRKRVFEEKTDDASKPSESKNESAAKRLRTDASSTLGTLDPMKSLESQLDAQVAAPGVTSEAVQSTKISARGFSLSAKSADVVPTAAAISASQVESTDASNAEAQTSESMTSGISQMPSIVHKVVTREDCRHEISYPEGWDAEQDRKASLMGKNSAETGEKKPAKTYPFELDAFQRAAVEAIDQQQSVLVSAHTSAGKTAVAEYAIATALRDNQRVIYTSPIKALSNQKYRELLDEFSDVGLMTGDVTISPNASVLVMTTEILRSMLYRGSEILREIGWVCFDEIHYMRDKERGVVWEETIILLPDKVRFVFLSATIPNAKEFADWVATIHRQPCHVVYTDYRPTPLQHYMFPTGSDGLYLIVDEKGRFREENFQKALSVISASEEQQKSGGRDAKGSKKSGGKSSGKKGPSDVFKIVKMIMEREFDPVIVFSFSKRECEALALQAGKVDFNTEDEKALVEQVFRNAIDSLSEEDQKLPQVETILPLLKKGIGIHHSGLLPILKEVIELLFQEHLLKCLFSTETFSMGLNMPAKTVVFTSLRKFDGQEFRWVSSGEYIQMSGRAGRRGLDDRGIVIMLAEEKIEPAVAKQMMSGKADPLNSSFHLNYNMLLNLLRVEEVDPEYLMQRSFFQFQNDRAKPMLEKRLKELEAESKALVIPNESVVGEYYTLRKQVEKLRNQLVSIQNQPKYILPFLFPGRLVRVYDSVGGTDWGYGIVVNFHKHTSEVKGASSTIPFLEGENTQCYYTVDCLLHVRVPKEFVDSGNAQVPVSELRPAQGLMTSRSKDSVEEDGSKVEFRVVPLRLPWLAEISTLRVNMPKDLRPVDARRAVALTVREILKRSEKDSGVTLLDPIEDMGVKDEEFERLVHRLEHCEDKLKKNEVYAAILKKPKKDKKSGSKSEKKSDDSGMSSADASEAVLLYAKRERLNLECSRLRKSLKSSYSVVLRDTLRSMKRVLRRLGCIDSSGIIQTKGRVGCEINTADELLLTEMIFTGVFNDLSPEQTTALMSCLVCQEKKEERGAALRPELAQPLQQLRESARRIATVSQEAKISIDIEEYVQSFKPNFMEITYAWCQGKKFVEIMKLTDVFEGTIIRSFRRLEELMRQMVVAAKVIGDASIGEKFEAGADLLKRDIVFAASLYL